MKGMLALACLAALAAPAAGQGGNGINVSWGDHIVIFQGDGKLDTPERIEKAVEDWHTRRNVTEVYWRVSDWFIDRYAVHRQGSFPKYFDEVRRIYAAFDPADAAIKAAHARGMRVYAYHTILDEGSPPEVRYGDSTPFPWQSRFTLEHPEYIVCDREGKRRQWGVMEYAYPEARRYSIGIFTTLLDRYDFDGVYVCTRTHSRPAEAADEMGFNEPVVKAYQERYGVDIRRQEFDVAKWRDLRGEFLTQFFAELHAEMARRGKRVIAAIPRSDVLGPPYGNMTLPWREWVERKLVDGLVVGVGSGNFHYPSMRGRDRERGYLASQDEGWGLPPVDEDVRQRYAPLCRKHGVELRLQGGSWTRMARERAERLGLTGYMLGSFSFVEGPAYASVPAQPALDFADARFTVECWVKLEGKSGNGRVVSKYAHEAVDNAGRGWEIYIDEESQVVFRLNDGEREHALKSEGTVPEGRWCHVACVSEGKGGKMRVFLDGRPDAERPAPERLRVVPVDFHIGCYGGGGVYLNGALDEVRLSRVPRAITGVPTGPAQADADTVALWRFEDAGATAESLAGGAAFRAAIDGIVARTDGPPGCGTALLIGRRTR